MKPTNKQIIETYVIEKNIKNAMDQIRIQEAKWKINFPQAKHLLKMTQNYATIVYNLILTKNDR